MRVLWLTNDLPPRPGGIEEFVGNLLARVHPADTVVVGPRRAGAAAFDAAQPYWVVRHPGRIVLPTPRTLRLVRAVARRHRPEVIVLGAAWPLGELAPALADDPGVPVVALTHGLEAGLASVGLGSLVRRATRGCAAVTTISAFTRRRLARHLRAPVVEDLPPGVDPDRFRPDVDGTALRTRWGVPADALVVGCISRLVRRKGQDTLVAVWPRIRARHPDAWLVLVGEGPLRGTLERAVARLGPDARAVVTGPVSGDQLPAAHAALDVFALPCRTRWLGADVEGLGIVSLEAQACAVPVVVGRSGGAPETVEHGRTGLVVDGRDRVAVAGAVSRLLGDAELRRSMGTAGRQRVDVAWSWDAVAARFRALLDGVVSGSAPRP